jgi:hypothetical protein
MEEENSREIVKTKRRESKEERRETFSLPKLHNVFSKNFSLFWWDRTATIKRGIKIKTQTTRNNESGRESKNKTTTKIHCGLRPKSFLCNKFNKMRTEGTHCSSDTHWGNIVRPQLLQPCSFLRVLWTAW